MIDERIHDVLIKICISQRYHRVSQRMQSLRHTASHNTAHPLCRTREVAAVVRSIKVIKATRAKQIMIDASVTRKSIFARRHRRRSVCNQFRLEIRSLMLSRSFLRDAFAQSIPRSRCDFFVNVEESTSERLGVSFGRMYDTVSSSLKAFSLKTYGKKTLRVFRRRSLHFER